MTQHKRPVLAEDQQALLQGVELRLLQPEERARFDQLLLTEHYLKSAQLVGEQLRYVAEHHGQWVALFTWSAGAFRLREREMEELRSARATKADARAALFSAL